VPLTLTRSYKQGRKSTSLVVGCSRTDQRIQERKAHIAYASDTETIPDLEDVVD